MCFTGNVTVDNETGIVKEAKSTRMTYYVKYETETEREFANRWFTSVTEALQKYIEETGEEVRLVHTQPTSDKTADSR